jgi:hypothetical protein
MKNPQERQCEYRHSETDSGQEEKSETESDNERDPIVTIRLFDFSAHEDMINRPVHRDRCVGSQVLKFGIATQLKIGSLGRTMKAKFDPAILPSGSTFSWTKK